MTRQCDCTVPDCTHVLTERGLINFRCVDGQNVVDVEDETPTSFEQISDWATVILATLSTFAVVCGAAGYLYATYF